MRKNQKEAHSASNDWMAQMERAFAQVEAVTKAEAEGYALTDARRQKKVRHLNTDASRAIAGGNHEAAIELYQQALQLDENNTVSLTSLGNLYVERGEYSQAYQYFGFALGADPEYVPALVGLGRMLIRQQNFMDAQRRFKQALKIDAKNCYAWTGLAEVFARQGMTNAARDKYQQAVDLNPHNPVARLQLALLQHEAGQDDKAYSNFTDVLWIDRGNKIAALLKAQIEMERQEFSKARHTLISVLDKNMDESCLVLYFALTSPEDEAHNFYANKIGPEKYEELQPRIKRCEKNPGWEIGTFTDSETDNRGILRTLLCGPPI